MKEYVSKICVDVVSLFLCMCDSVSSWCGTLRVYRLVMTAEFMQLCVMAKHILLRVHKDEEVP